MTPGLGNNAPSQRLPANTSYQLLDVNVQTLWANNEQGEDIEGLLFVPDIAPSTLQPGVSQCLSMIPPNATRREDLPPVNYPLVAIAPWQDFGCNQAFLRASQTAVSAFIFFLPNNGTDDPPSVSSSVWHLGTGSWGGLNNLPIYAIPGSAGFAVLQQLSLYSGNISSVPGGDVLEQEFKTGDYVRLYANFNTSGASHYPTLWAFLLIILGIVLVLLIATSLSMRYKQRRNRNALRQRIAAGQVDLETLGLKKPPRMSQADVDALPRATYTPLEHGNQPSARSVPTNTPAVPPSSPRDYNQVSCAICLDDYVADETTVRILPCRHIYHPDCIDPHLLSSNSLCPLCKAQVPTIAESTGQTDSNSITIPPITNAMVRRERYMRQIRERGARESVVESPTEWFQRRLGRPLFATVGVRTATRRQRASREVSTGELEMQAVPPDNSGPALNPESVPLPPSPVPASWLRTAPAQSDREAHREWARRRASALLHRQSRANGEPSTNTAAVAAEVDERAALPAWRRGLNSVFPGFR